MLIRITILGVFLGSTLMAPPAAAEDPTPIEPRILEWPTVSGYGEGGVFTRAVAGRFAGLERISAFVLKHTAGVVVAYAAHHVAYKALDYEVNDFDVEPGGGPDEWVDALIAVGPGGLWRTYLDATTGEFVDELIEPAWANAKRVRVGDVNGDGLPDLAVLDDDEVTFLFKFGQPDKTFVDGGSFLSDDPAKTFELVQWNGGGGLELVISTTSGVDVRNSGGRLLSRHLSLQPELDRIQVLRETGSAYHQVALITAVDAVTDTIMLVVFDKFSVGMPLVLTGRSVAAMTAGDLDQDSHSELVMGRTDERTAEVFWNNGVPGTMEPYSLRDTLELTMGDDQAPHDENLAQPLIVDADADGVLDVFLPSEAEESIFLHSGGANEFNSPLSDPDFLRPSVGMCVSDDPLDQGGHVRLNLRYPNMLPLWNRFEIVVWKLDTFGDPPPQEPIYHCLHQIIEDLSDPARFELDIPFGGSGVLEEWFDNPELYQFGVRPVYFNAVDRRIEHAGQEVLGEATTSEDDQDYLVEHADQGWIPKIGMTVTACDGPESGYPTAGFVRSNQFLPWPPGNLPAYGDLSCTK